jgi:hypothetical protein
MAALTPQSISDTLRSVTYTAIAASDTVTISGLGNTAFLHIKNTNGSINTCTIVDAGLSPAGNSGVDDTYTIPATTGDVMIRLKEVLAADGVVTITNSNTTGGTCAVFYLA